MKVLATAIEGVLQIIPKRHEDDRGFFSETYSSAELSAQGLGATFVQDNHSLSRQTGILRGLHYQKAPRAQAKLVRVTRGSAFDVAVDIRKGSPTFGHWVGVTLSADAWNQLFIPKGFAHGFLTLEPDTEFVYKVTDHYSADHDRAIRFDDPAIGIQWPMPLDNIKTSAKDCKAPTLEQADNDFIF